MLKHGMNHGAIIVALVECQAKTLWAKFYRLRKPHVCVQKDTYGEVFYAMVSFIIDSR